jgi:hypothetical protein
MWLGLGIGGGWICRLNLCWRLVISLGFIRFWPICLPMGGRILRLGLPSPLVCLLWVVRFGWLLLTMGLGFRRVFCPRFLSGLLGGMSLGLGVLGVRVWGWLSFPL